MQNLNQFRGSEPHVFFCSSQCNLITLLLHFDAQRVTFERNARVYGAIGLGRVIGLCSQRFTRNSHRFMRSGEIEIAARGREDRFLLLRAETVASGFLKLVSFERFENRVADFGLSENGSARGVTLFMNFFDYA